jgi:high-affinity iron transporter
LLSALLIALREGVEAALIVGIVLVYLNRTSRAALAKYVWAGVIAAIALSAAVAAALAYWQVSEDGFEGVLLLVAAFFVVTMIIWMNRMARRLRKEIEHRVETLAGKSSRAAGWGLFLFVFLMVVREGAELALILRAVEFSAAGVNVWIGTFLGLAIAVAVGVFFFQGTLKIPIGRFFAATSIILMVVAFQLALTGVHELSEAQWLASSQREMAIVGPIVRNDVFFFVVILGLVAFLVLREWLTMSQSSASAAAAAKDMNDAEKRRLEWDRRRQRRWMFAAAASSLIVILVLAGEFVYGRTVTAQAPAQTLAAQNGEVRIPIAGLDDGQMHFFTAQAGGESIRFFVIHKPTGWGVALDACQICGRMGYRQDGQNVICRNCDSAIYIPSIGDVGGCNPVGVKSRMDGEAIIVALPDLQESSAKVPN